MLRHSTKNYIYIENSSQLKLCLHNRIHIMTWLIKMVKQWTAARAFDNVKWNSQYSWIYDGKVYFVSPRSQSHVGINLGVYITRYISYIHSTTIYDTYTLKEAYRGASVWFWTRPVNRESVWCAIASLLSFGNILRAKVCCCVCKRIAQNVRQ